MNKAHHYLLVTLPLILLCACTPNISPDTYSVGAVGQASRTVRGTIVNAREVNIRGAESVGTSAGILSGGAAGSALGGDDVRLNIIGAVGGAVVGGIAGSAIERNSTKQTGFEYIVETSNGALITIVQGGSRLIVGQKVFVLYGTRSRIIPVPKTD